MAAINGQLFKMWKQAPGIFDEQAIFLPYFGDDKAVAEEKYQTEKGTTWRKYRIWDSKIQVVTKLEALSDENVREDTEWTKHKSQNFTSAKNPYKKNAIHTFVGARLVLNLYLRSLSRLRDLVGQDIKNWDWVSFKWKDERNLSLLCIQIDEENDAQKYVPGTNKIILGKTNDEFNCQSLDFVSHEIGHAILHSIRSDSASKRVFQEAFAYLTNIFTLLSMFDICELLITETEGDLNNPNFVSRFAEQKYNDSSTRGLESIVPKKDFNPTMQRSLLPESDEIHNQSLEVVRAVFACLIKAFEFHHNVAEYDLAESLFRANRVILDLFLYATLNIELESDKPNYLLSQLNEKMLDGLWCYPISSLAYKIKLREVLTQTLVPEKQRLKGHQGDLSV